jgi:RNA polymerase sigma factor (sigma-70 family)
LSYEPEQRELVEPSACPSPEEKVLEELEFVYGFLYTRVGNRSDAEDLAQQVANKAMARLRQGVSPYSIRTYLFATARSLLAGFWAQRFKLSEQELQGDSWLEQWSQAECSGGCKALELILNELPAEYRRVLQLRFLRSYPLRKVAAELGSTVSAVKVMQLRALQAAAKVMDGG